MNISVLLNNPQKLNEVFEKALEKRDMEIINTLLPYIKNPKLIYKYARDIVRGKVNDELEDIIAQDPDYSYFYAKEVLNGSFPKGENAIAKDEECSYFYAKNILKGPFPKGEDTIAKSSEYSYRYACDVLNGPFPKGENAIAKDEEYNREYFNRFYSEE